MPRKILTPTEKVIRTALFQRRKHRGQVRKGTGEPYGTHPIRVARIVKKTLMQFNPKMFESKAGLERVRVMVQASLLHDV